MVVMPPMGRVMRHWTAHDAQAMAEIAPGGEVSAMAKIMSVAKIASVAEVRAAAAMGGSGSSGGGRKGDRGCKSGEGKKLQHDRLLGVEVERADGKGGTGIRSLSPARSMRYSLVEASGKTVHGYG
jgi:hypothetical protein